MSQTEITNNSRIDLIQGDITSLSVDVVVNAANSSLLGGGGVDGAIHRVGGPAILEACKAIRAREGGCPAGHAVITTAGNLPARFVVHTVGPVWQGGHVGEDTLLFDAYASSFRLALEHGAHSMAFPNISTGVYRFPKQRAAQIALNATEDALQDDRLQRVVFVCFDQENYDIYRKLLNL